MVTRGTMDAIVFFDLEVDPRSNEVKDIGAVKADGTEFHGHSMSEFARFTRNCFFGCGHNVFLHDLKYAEKALRSVNAAFVFIDTLFLSPLLFPTKPYHKLLKDDKLQADELNNPLNDSKKARDLFYDEINAYQRLRDPLKRIYRALLGNQQEFRGFFLCFEDPASTHVAEEIRQEFRGKICEHSPIEELVINRPVELAYSLALIQTDDRYSITPPWVLHHYPQIDNVMHLLREHPCAEGCAYCDQKLDVRRRLKEIFGFDGFRTYEGEPLQENAARAAVEGKSLLAIFPTGGGKSVTFQLPALIAGETTRGLTVVISPLQSLMKDQVDHLEERGIVDAVTINGLLDPIQRKEAIERVASGMASLLYLSPESLRSNTIEKLLLSRNVVRFVIDEAHCFSAWGQDFRVDYLYIGPFIRKLQELRKTTEPIPVSCFTATAKQKVVSDIREYFRRHLGLDLQLFATSASRKNLHYAVLFEEDDERKYLAMRNLIQSRQCPTIVYVSAVKRTYELSERLGKDGFSALPFNGRMESSDKIQTQNAFLQGETQIIVATSAFGMGVDKKDVKLVIHYDISDSLENYVQEAGRAGRDETIQAECYVLFNDADLDKHFILLNQTKLSISEIQQIWRAIKDLAKKKAFISSSPLEIARQAGWDDEVADIETRVKTAVAALEQAGYVERGRNVPHVYADSLLVKNMMDASERIESSGRFTGKQKELAKRTIGFLISRKSTFENRGDDAESRVDYIADHLGVDTEEIIEIVNLLREEEMLEDHLDLAATIDVSDSQNRSENTLKRFLRAEEFLLEHLPEDGCINYKELNEEAVQNGIKNTSVKLFRTIVFYWTIAGYIRKEFSREDGMTHVEWKIQTEEIRSRLESRAELSLFIIRYLFDKSVAGGHAEQKEVIVEFSVMELLREFRDQLLFRIETSPVNSDSIQRALLYLSKIQALSIEGGFLVTYNAMQIRRLELDNRIQYKQDDYRQLDEYYKQKVQQIHIVGEYAHLMVKDYQGALQFVSDYFQLDYKAFLSKYFKGDRQGEINRNITPEKYNLLFGTLSEAQLKIIEDDTSQYIVVTAGPGSGKTRILVHKLASLLMLEDVKHEQMLMLTFSRAAATEFKSRLMKLIGNAAHFVEIKTFHSYCFDLIGRIGNLEDSEGVVETAAEKIREGEVEVGRITKSVLVIDEAQDMDAHDYDLVCALMKRNENLRVIAVGDDDQSIYGFRGSDPKYFASLISRYGAKKYELLENYRSDRRIVACANRYAATIRDRMKTEPIISVTGREGLAELIRYSSQNLELPAWIMLEPYLSKGTCCILTETNDEALRMAGMLREKNIPAKLIQSNDGFVLANLREIRFFLEYLQEKQRSPVIDEGVWDTAVEELEAEYRTSEQLPLVRKILKTYESVNPRKYFTDLMEFLIESQLEDFLDAGQKNVIVSTIHKAKGREFDHVFILLKNRNTDCRALYVGMTRAKNSLHLLVSGNGLGELEGPELKTGRDDGVYPEAERAVLALTLKGVFLDYFIGREQLTRSLRSGDRLVLNGRYLNTADGKTVGILSKKAQDQIGDLELRGYRFERAKVQYIVDWRSRDGEKQATVLLPEITMKKRRNHELE